MSKIKWDVTKHKDLMLSGVMLVLMMLLQANSHAFAENSAFSKVQPPGEEIYQTLNEIGTGSLVAKTNQGYAGLVRLGNDISIAVNGMLVSANIQQKFQNNTPNWIEATYVFPLPSNSVVHQMKIRIGDRLIEGVIKEKQQARKLFVEAKRQGKQAGLLEQQRPNLFTTRVANIAPGETVAVDFSYLQELHYRDGEFSLRLPLTITPRYIPGRPVADVSALHGDAPAGMPAYQVVSVAGWSFPTDQVPDAHEITPFQVPQAANTGNSHHARIAIELSPGFELADVHSPYHGIGTQRQGGTYQITPKNNPVLMNRDFVISWKPVAQQQPVAAVFTESLSSDSENAQNTPAVSSEHLLMMLMPPMQATSDVVPPRELIIIVDTSGSMAGAAIQQAKQAVQMALDKLRPSDQFNLIEFNSSHRALFQQSQMADASSLSAARNFVNQLDASGGTEMYSALHAALSSPESESFLKQVVFITDGSVGNEAALLQLIGQSLNNSRLYTVGIGSAPNEFFMRKAAEFGKGTFSMIGSQQEVQQKMAQLFARIEKPVMTNLKVYAPGNDGEFFPANIPDLYQGEPLLVNARFNQWPAELRIEGEYNGQPWEQRLSLGQQVEAPGVATLWARKKVQSLEDEGISLGQRDTNKDQITQLGLDYSIVTRFTSFVAVAQQVVRPSAESLTSQPVPALMPHGSQQQAPAVGMPQTALGIEQKLMLGLLAMLFGLMLYRLQYRCNFSAIRYAFTRAQ